MSTCQIDSDGTVFQDAHLPWVHCTKWSTGAIALLLKNQQAVDSASRRRYAELLEATVPELDDHEQRVT